MFVVVANVMETTAKESEKYGEYGSLEYLGFLF